VSAGELRAHPCAAKTLDRFAEPGVGTLTFAEQSLRPGRDPERPLGSGRAGLAPQTIKGVTREVSPSGSRGWLNQLAETPVLSNDFPLLAC
jgi:hypothetical protein